MTDILFALVALALVVGFVLVAMVVRRSRSGAYGSAERGVPAKALGGRRPRSPTRPVAPGADDLVLVPLPNDTGQALVIGPEEALAVFDKSGLTGRQTGAGFGAVPQLVRNAMAAGAMKATDRFQTGANSGRIVALAPETMEHLAKGKPVFDKAGNVLALVRGDNSKLSHVMRLDKAGAQVAAASNTATLAVTAALSQQLEAISEQLQEMSETLEGMVKDRDRERLSDALAANEILFEIAESVRRRGITQADYMQLASQASRDVAPDRNVSQARRDRPRRRRRDEPDQATRRVGEPLRERTTRVLVDGAGPSGSRTDSLRPADPPLGAPLAP